MKKITARITVSGGSLLTAANAGRIVARSIRPTDPSGNSLPSPINLHRGKPPYFQTWRVKKEPAGFIFREQANGQGISGHHPTVRRLVISALLIPTAGIVVEVETT